MKSAFYEILAIALPITFFLGLPSGPPSIQPDPSEECVQRLVAIAKSKAATLTSSGDRVRIGSKEVRLKAQIEADERSPDNKKNLIGLRVDVFVDGALQPLTFGTVGIGRDRGEAVENAVSDWAMYVGYALLGALGVKIGEEPENVGCASSKPRGFAESSIWKRSSSVRSATISAMFAYLRIFLAGFSARSVQARILSLRTSLFGSSYLRCIPSNLVADFRRHRNYFG